MRPSSLAASPLLLLLLPPPPPPVLLVVAKDGNELPPFGDNVTLVVDLGKDDDDDDDDNVDDDEYVLAGDDCTDLPLAPSGSVSLNDRFSDLTGFTKIHFGVARDAAKSIKQAVDVKKHVKVKILRDFSIVPGGLYRDIV